MKRSYSKISNPLTIVAIFAGLAEVNGTIVLGLVTEELQSIFLWFIIIFPSALVAIFFLILNFNPKVLYAPSDFSDEDNFMKTLNTKRFEPQQISFDKTNYQRQDQINLTSRKPESKGLNKGPFADRTKAHVTLANKFFNHFRTFIKEQFDQGIFEEVYFGVQAPEYFLMELTVPKEILQRENLVSRETIIIRVTENLEGKLALIAIGKDIEETDPEKFGKKLHHYINDRIEKIVDKKKVKN